MTVKIRSVEFVGSVADPGVHGPDDLPQVAFSGRSNVGKSSLINVLLRRTRKRVARVSASPGKTQTLNFYRVNDRFYLVDLPGFGYARVPDRVREQWKRLVEAYLEGSPALRGVVHLVDARHDPTAMDQEMVEYLASLEIPALVVLTKVDKLGSQERARKLPAAVELMGLDREQVVPFSAKTGEGREVLLEALDGLLRDGDGEAEG